MNMEAGKVVRALGSAGLLSLVLATPAPAAEPTPWYGAALASYVEPDGNRDADSALGLAAIYGAPLSQMLAVETNAFYHRSKAESNGDHFPNWGVGVDLNFLGQEAAGQPFMLVGFGSTVEKQPSGKAGSYYVDAGLGFVVPRFYSERYALRAEVRWYSVFNDDFVPGEDRLDDLRFNIGLQFGPPAMAAPAPAPEPAPTPAVMEPEPMPVPAPAPVRPAAPADSDADGVFDAADLCPGTARGQRVDARGCVVLEEVKLSGVGFTAGSAILTGSAKAVLDGVASALAARPDVKIEIAGHTDSVGADATNLNLSQRRADAVRTYLISRGVAPERLTAKGYGETRPVDSNDTLPGRANNRRVEFKVR